MIKKIFTSDTDYRQMTVDYNRTDALLAVGLYIFCILSYFVMGVIQSTKGVYLGIYVNVFLMLVCVAIVLIRKQKLQSIGLTPRHFTKALIVGLVCGVVFSMLNIIPAIASGGKWIGFTPLLWNIPYYLIIIGLQEEILFRGYIQTRLYGALKSEVLTVITCGLMFAVIHVPYQFYNRGYNNFIEFMGNNGFSLFMTFIWHLVFNFLYRKFNSLTAPTACHFLMNLSSTFFG